MVSECFLILLLRGFLTGLNVREETPRCQATAIKLINVARAMLHIMKKHNAISIIDIASIQVFLGVHSKFKPVSNPLKSNIREHSKTEYS